MTVFLVILMVAGVLEVLGGGAILFGQHTQQTVFQEMEGLVLMGFGLLQLGVCAGFMGVINALTESAAAAAAAAHQERSATASTRV
jgi:hypothetical protein